MDFTNETKNSTTFTNNTVSVLPNTISGCILWLRADSLALSNGAAAEEWFDESSSGNHTNQTGTACPTFVTNVVNSLPVLRFDGTNDYLILDSNVSTVRQYFIVAKWSGTNNLTSILGRNEAPLMFFGGTSATGLIIHQTFSYSQIVNGTAYNNGTLLASTASLYRDFNQFQLFSSTTTTTNMTFNNIGATFHSSTYYFGGDVAEIIVFDAILSEPNRLLVQNYLSRKYNIPTGTGYTPMTNEAKT